MTLAIVSVGIYFPIVLLIGIPEALRDDEHLVWWGDLSVIIPFLNFFLRSCEDKSSFALGFLNISSFCNFFLQF